MSKKEEFIKKEKEQATIKVKSLVIVLALVITHLGSAFGGWVLRSHDNGRITWEAKQLVQTMNVSKANK